MKNSFYCPSCGYNLGFIPWDDGSPADEMCSSCGIQFGYDDFAGGNEEVRQSIYEKWRQNWISMGMPWKSSRKKPFRIQICGPKNN